MVLWIKYVWQAYLYEKVHDAKRNQDNEEDGGTVADDEHCCYDTGECAQPDTGCQWNVEVHCVDVLWEAVHDSTERCSVEERHWGSENGVKKVWVEHTWSLYTADGDRERLSQDGYGWKRNIAGDRLDKYFINESYYPTNLSTSLDRDIEIWLTVQPGPIRVSKMDSVHGQN